MCPLYIMSETWLHSERAFSTFTNKRVDLTIAYPSDMLKKKKKAVFNKRLKSMDSMICGRGRFQRRKSW